MSDENNMRESWRTQGAELCLPSLDEVRAGSDLFRRKIVRRNLVEYAASALVVVVFTIYVFVIPHPITRIGAALVVVGTLVVVWQLHRRASPLPPEAAGGMSVYGFLRAQLVRQRDALASVFWWYLAPLIPGLGLMMFGRSIEGISQAGARALVGVSLGALFVFAVFFGIWWLNQRGARFLQRMIEEIDALTEEME